MFSTSSKNYGTNALATTAYDDGYTAGGMYYCNGTGGETRRNVTINNVIAGDKIVVYMASSNAATGTLVFKYLGEDNEQVEKASFTKRVLNMNLWLSIVAHIRCIQMQQQENLYITELSGYLELQ